jgi:hypothetical protein
MKLTYVGRMGSREKRERMYQFVIMIYESYMEVAAILHNYIGCDSFEETIFVEL